MRPKKGFAINPPAQVPWKGRIVNVRNADEAIQLLNLSGDEVEDFLKAVSDVAPNLVEDHGNVPLLPAMVNFVRAWLKNDGESEPIEEIERRKQICLNCPEAKHEDFGCTVCGGIASVMLKAPKIDGLKGMGCRKCRCYLPVKVSQKAIVLAADKRKIHYPENCWVPGVLSQS